MFVNIDEIVKMHHNLKNINILKLNYDVDYEFDDKVQIVKVCNGYIYNHFNENSNVYKIKNTYIVESARVRTEDLEKYIPDINKYVEEMLVDKMTEDYKQMYKEYKNNIENKKIELNRYKKALVETAKEIEHYNTLLTNKDSVKKIKEKVKREIQLIMSHKNFDGIVFNDSKLFIKVKNIIIYEPNSNKYYWLGYAEIELDFINGIIRFNPTPISEMKRGYWDDEQIHPHVDDCGSACLGNADIAIAEYLSNREYFAAYMVSVNFLKSVNVEDVAGYAVSFWDECDKNGTIINEGHAPSRTEYGEDIPYAYDHASTYSENNYVCDDCEEEFDYELVELETEDGTIHVCNECAENYVYCEDTERYTYYENAYKIGDNYYERRQETFTCDDCGEEFLTCDMNTLDTPEGEIHICDNCVEKYAYCEDTERSVLINDAYYDGNTWYENDPNEPEIPEPDETILSEDEY